MDPAKPQADGYVLRTLMRHKRLTRAELAAEIGISKPTAGESVRRLTERNLVVDTGERTPGGRGRGRVGSYYALAPGVGTALAVSIAPEGVVAERIDAYGEVVSRVEREIGRPALPAQVAAALTEAAQTSVDRPRLAVISAADPVDRETGRLIQLPDAPFLVGELDPVEILAPLVAGPVIVDNDVNWAAQAERHGARDDFAYLFLGEGLGCAIVSDGSVRRGRHGLAGEVAHIVTEGPGGRAIRFTDAFTGVHRPGTTAIDAKRLLKIGDRQDIARAVAGVVAAIIALADPDRVVIGGTWGPPLLDSIRKAVATLPREVPIAAATKDAFTAVRTDALERLQTSITNS